MLQISRLCIFGLAESGFKDGIIWGNFEWFSAFELIILAFIFVPFYLRTKITTLPEFLEKRYDGRSRIILAIFSILAALFIHIGVSFYAGAVVFEKMFGLDILISIIIIAIATGVLYHNRRFSIGCGYRNGANGHTHFRVLNHYNIGYLSTYRGGH